MAKGIRLEVNQHRFAASRSPPMAGTVVSPGNVLKAKMPAALTDLPEEVEGAAIFGLDWLINAPKVEAIVLDGRGYPAPVVAIDPRVFALHRAWISKRDDREPMKARRDKEQARAAALIATRYMRLPFDCPELSALPIALRDMARAVVQEAEAGESADGESPDW